VSHALGCFRSFMVVRVLRQCAATCASDAKFAIARASSVEPAHDPGRI
jgi:hypothetical protein